MLFHYSSITSITAQAVKMCGVWHLYWGSFSFHSVAIQNAPPEQMSFDVRIVDLLISDLDEFNF